MTEESEVSLPSQEPRHCPECDMKVAARASECLMCGTSLVQDQEVEEEETEDRRRIPGWIGSLVVVVLAAAIVAGGGFGLYRMLAVDPEPAAATPRSTPSSTPTATATPVPTDTPLPTSTPTPLPPRAHSVQEGETMSDIAAAYDVTVDQILALNPGVEPELIQPEQVLLVPAAGGASSVRSVDEPGHATSTPGAFAVHVIETGDTLLSIALEYDVSVSLIRTANDLSPEDETIRAGQSLVIPLTTPTPTPTPTVPPNATPTPRSPYTAPSLLYPPDESVFVEEAPVLLQWTSVDVLQEDEWYEVSLLLPTGDVLSDTVRTRATAWRVSLDLLQTSSDDLRRFNWRVRVVREVGDGVFQQAGAPSEIRSFVWRGPIPTSTPEP